MSIHFVLDFMTPFGVGDQVYVLHPPKDVPCRGGPAWLHYRKGTIARVKLVFDLNPGNGLIVAQPTEQKVLEVERVVYTIVCQPLEPHQSAFMVECPTSSDNERRLFSSEEDVQSYLEAAVV
jgi:hypothetical protein